MQKKLQHGRPSEKEKEEFTGKDPGENFTNRGEEYPNHNRRSSTLTES